MSSEDSKPPLQGLGMPSEVFQMFEAKLAAAKSVAEAAQWSAAIEQLKVQYNGDISGIEPNHLPDTNGNN
jgi:hypothetical protein